MGGSLKFNLDRLGRCLVHWNLILAVLVDIWLTQTWSRRSWSIAGSHLICSQPHWLMADSQKFDLDRLSRWAVHWNLISTVLVVLWFTETWSAPSWSISDSLKFDLDRLDRCLIHWNLISTVLADVWLPETWSQPPWLMADSLKFELDRLSRWAVH